MYESTFGVPTDPQQDSDYIPISAAPVPAPAGATVMYCTVTISALAIGSGLNLSLRYGVTVNGVPQALDTVLAQAPPTMTIPTGLQSWVLQVGLRRDRLAGASVTVTVSNPANGASVSGTAPVSVPIGPLPG